MKPDDAAPIPMTIGSIVQLTTATPLGYIGNEAAGHLLNGGHASTTITSHKAMLDDIAIYAAPQPTTSREARLLGLLQSAAVVLSRYSDDDAMTVANRIKVELAAGGQT